jgi:hypothetical protein
MGYGTMFDSREDKTKWTTTSAMVAFDVIENADEASDGHATES